MLRDLKNALCRSDSLVSRDMDDPVRKNHLPASRTILFSGTHLGAVLSVHDLGLPWALSNAPVRRESLSALDLSGGLPVAAVGYCPGFARYPRLALSPIHQCLLGMVWVFFQYEGFSSLRCLSDTRGGMAPAALVGKCRAAYPSPDRGSHGNVWMSQTKV